MLSETKRKAVAYWEKRRVIYNLLLIPPAWLGWHASSELTSYINDQIPASLSNPQVLLALVLFWVAANTCYTFVYVLEFFFLTESPGKFWPTPGRTLFLILGCILGMCLASRSMSQLQVNLAESAYETD